METPIIQSVGPLLEPDRTVTPAAALPPRPSPTSDPAVVPSPANDRDVVLRLLADERAKAQRRLFTFFATDLLTSLPRPVAVFKAERRPLNVIWGEPWRPTDEDDAAREAARREDADWWGRVAAPDWGDNDVAEE